jgi:hypothetical protein
MTLVTQIHSVTAYNTRQATELSTLSLLAITAATILLQGAYILINTLDQASASLTASLRQTTIYGKVNRACLTTLVILLTLASMCSQADAQGHMADISTPVPKTSGAQLPPP